MNSEIQEIGDTLFAKALRWANVKVGLEGASTGYNAKEVTEQIMRYFFKEAGIEGDRKRIRGLIESKLQEWNGRGLLGKMGTGEIRIRGTGDEYISDLLSGKYLEINLNEIRKIIKDSELFDYLAQGIREGRYDKITRDAAVYVEVQVKKHIRHPCKTFTEFAEKYTGPESGCLAPKNWTEQQAKGLRKFGIGLSWIIRNPSAHGKYTIDNPADFIRGIVILDYYLDLIRQSSPDENLP